MHYIFVYMLLHLGFHDEVPTFVSHL